MWTLNCKLWVRCSSLFLFLCTTFSGWIILRTISKKKNCMSREKPLVYNIMEKERAGEKTSILYGFLWLNHRSILFMNWWFNRHGIVFKWMMGYCTGMIYWMGICFRAFMKVMYFNVRSFFSFFLTWKWCIERDFIRNFINIKCSHFCDCRKGFTHMASPIYYILAFIIIHNEQHYLIVNMNFRIIYMNR